MQNMVNNYLSGNLKSYNAYFATAAVITTFLSFMGFLVMADGPMETIGALLISLIGGIGIFHFWKLALEQVPIQKTLGSRVTAWLVLITGLIVIFGISSLMNMVGLQGVEAMKHDLKVETTKMATELDLRYQHGLSLSSLAADLRSDAAQFRSYADEENLKGTYSGFAGSGAVHRSFVTVSYRLDTLVTEAEAFSQANEAHYMAISAALDEIRRVQLDTRLPLNERIRRTEVKSDEVFRHLNNMDPRYIAASISRTAQALPSEIDLRVSYSRNKDVAKKQRQALERAEDEVQQVSAKLVGIATDIAESEQAPLTRFEVKSPVKAVLIHAPSFLGFWMAAICADAFPIFVIVYLCLNLYRKTDEEIAHDTLMAVTAGQIILARLANEATRLGHLDKKSGQLVTQDFLGRSETGE